MSRLLNAKTIFLLSILVIGTLAFSSYKYVPEENMKTVTTVNGSFKTKMNPGNNEITPKGNYNITMDERFLIANEYYDSAFDVISAEPAGRDYLFVVGTVQNGNMAYNAIFVQKVNQSGDIVWNRTITFEGYIDEGYAGCLGTDGNYIYITGFTTNTTLGYRDLVLIKLDFDGNLIWKVAWGEKDANEVGYGIVMDHRWQSNQYGIYVTGYRYKPGDDWDLILVKFDINGNEVWNKTYDGGYDDIGYDVSTTYNGIVTVVGASYDGTNYRALIVKYDYDGNIIKGPIRYVNTDGSWKFIKIGKTWSIESYIYVTGVMINSDGSTHANIYKLENDTLSMVDEGNFPIGNKNSTAYGVYYRGGILYITGTVENNNVDEFLWIVSPSNMETLGFYVHDSGYDDYARGISYISDSSSNIYFFIVAGERYHVVNDEPKYDYYFDVWSPDTDSDGLSNYWEIRNNTDMLNNDTDNDGLLDGSEIYNFGTNPLNNDTDEDGVLDGAEVNTYCTNPLNNDTDSDGLDDYSEIFIYRTNPNNSDTDGDGLGDYEEIETYNTNATNTDSDKDGMPDGWEVANSFNPNDGSDADNDADNDGLSNLGEYQHGSNPHNSDTDGDGMPDGWEISYNLNPINSSDAALDNDDDDLTNIQEFQHGTNPLINDTDQDGMPDGWEVNYGLNPTDSADAQEDADNDGITNLDEYLNNTDPTRDNVAPTINSIWTQPGSPNNATETVIYANVVDSNGVAQVNLTYTINGVTHSVTMNYNSTSGYYYYSLGVLEEGTTVYYSISATDEFGNLVTSNEYNFTVIGVENQENEENNEAPNTPPSTEKNISDYIPYIVIFLAASIVVALSFRRMKKKG